MPIPIHCAHDEVVAIGKIKPNPRNPNTHPPEQIALLAKIIKAQGWRNPIVVSNRSGFITKGHARLTAATALGCKVVPVDRQDYGSEKEEVADMIADNRIAELAEADRAMLRELAEELDDGSFDMDLTGFDQSALEELMTAAPPLSEVDAEPQIDKAEELRQKWGVERGQIWELGEHRLMCGDAVFGAEDSSRLMDGEKVAMVFTDPPYALFGNSTGVAKVCDDKMIRPFFRDIARVSMQHTEEFGHVYICCDWHSAPAIFYSVSEAGLKAKNLCIWDKGDGGMGANYQHCYECVWFFANSPKAHGIIQKKKTGERTVNGVPNIWRFPRVNGEERVEHTAQKPVAMICISIAAATNPNDGVADWFLGSGSTLIACEQLGRKCFAMEIDPGYVAVAIQRWVDATGKTPKLLK